MQNIFIIISEYTKTLRPLQTNYAIGIMKIANEKKKESYVH